MMHKRCLMLLFVVGLAACTSPPPSVTPTPTVAPMVATARSTVTPMVTTVKPTVAPEAAPPTESIPAPYLGETPPGAEPVLFRSGAVSTGAIELSLALHPNLQELYFTRLESGKATLMVSRQTGAGWTTPEPAAFSGEYDDVNPFISADGQTLLFSSRRPLAGGATSDGSYRLWFMERTGDDWSVPTRLVLPLESVGDEASPTLTRDGVLYYVADYPTLGGMGLYRAAFANGAYQMPEKQEVLVNSDAIVEVEPFIAPDESFILFYSAGRPDNLTPNGKTGDLYVVFRDSAGQWGAPQNLGQPINSTAEESTPTLSPDGRYLFFASNRGVGKRFPDLYWVETAFLPTLSMDAASRALSVPPGDPPVLDGQLTPGEWDGALRQEFTDGGELWLLRSGDYLYLAVRVNFAAPQDVVSAVCLARGDQVFILHSSASLGTAIFQRDAAQWEATQTFAWALGEPPTDPTAAEQQRQTFLAESRWLATLGTATTTGAVEYQIAIPDEPFSLALAYLLPPRAAKLEAAWWPVDLADDCRKISLLQGDAGQEQSAPLRLKFAPETWATIQLGE